MKFDFVIGNPPYNDDFGIGENDSFAAPVYHKFLDAAYQVADKVEMIHPARFLFNAGSTPKAWNQKILNDCHFKVLDYEQDSRKVFSNTEIKGGVVISYRNHDAIYETIQVFTPYEELNEIMHKAAPKDEADSLMSIVYLQTRFDLQSLYLDHPELKNVIGSDGRDKRFRNNIFDKIPQFTEKKVFEDDVAVLGVIKNKRNWRYLPLKYVDVQHENLEKFKVLVVRVNGTGALGEVLSTPVIAKPHEGFTQTFIGIGAFDMEVEANNCLAYIKTKFLRTMLGILKITQDNNRDTWRMIPLQDFTLSSDIDWSQSVANIDKQLYKKYNLSDEEINFIETNVKEME